MSLAKQERALVIACLIYVVCGKRIHFAQLQARTAQRIQSGRRSSPVSQLKDKDALQNALSGLGLAPPEVRDAVQYVLERSWPVDGAIARVNCLQHSINEGHFAHPDEGSRLPEYLEYLEQDFRTVYEDDHVVVSDKPFYVYMNTEDSGPRWPGEVSMMQHLLDTHPEVTTEDGNVRFCHNLDFATSGILVSAKTQEAGGMISQSFETRSAAKLYAALVFGHPPWERNTWNASIVPSRKQFRQHISESGKSAVTEVTVGARGTLKLKNKHKDREATLLWLEPRTGRRHQLRLHCAHAGFGIVGDNTYGNDEQESYRMFLHAAALKVHAEPMNFSFEAPFDWFHAFEPREELRSPERWPHASQALMVPRRLGTQPSHL